MSKVIKVQARDSIIKILGRENGVKGPVVYQWVKKVWELNPHISNPDLIYPGERILLPDQLQEHVPQKFIWENAFSQMPSQLNTMPPLSNQALAYQSEAGDTIDIIAEKMFSSSPNRVMPHGIKRAILLHNNQKLLKYQNIPIPTGIMINLTTYKLSASDIRNWEQIHIRVKIDLDTVDQSVKQAMYHSDMDALYVLSNNLTAITSADGYAAGLNDNVKLSPHAPAATRKLPKL